MGVAERALDGLERRWLLELQKTFGTDRLLTTLGSIQPSRIPQETNRTLIKVWRLLFAPWVARGNLLLVYQLFNSAIIPLALWIQPRGLYKSVLIAVARSSSELVPHPDTVPPYRLLKKARRISFSPPAQKQTCFVRV